MPPELTITERAALDRFLQVWRTETIRSGDWQYGYIFASLNEWQGEAIYRRVHRNDREMAA